MTASTAGGLAAAGERVREKEKTRNTERKGPSRGGGGRGRGGNHGTRRQPTLPEFGLNTEDELYGMSPGTQSKLWGAFKTKE